MPRLSPWFRSALAMLLFLPSCQTLRFYGQAVDGQLEILRKARPNSQVAADPATTPRLRKQLALAENIRRFASDHLALPGYASYGKYTELGREHLVWVLYATPEFSLKPKTWSYPLIGKMDYRGYFHPQDAAALAKQLRAQGYDVFVGDVDAYSTLGLFHDPLLNTFVHYPDVDLAEMIFHELTHHKVFRHGDTVFNESLANTVAEEGVKRWLQHEGRLDDLRKYQARLVRRREFYQEIDSTRRRLETLYASGKPASAMRREKAAAFTKLRDEFRVLHRHWGGHGLEGWLVEKLNNGHLASLKIYAEKMPAFRALLADCHGDFALFFKQAEHLKLAPSPCIPPTRNSSGGVSFSFHGNR